MIPNLLWTAVFVVPVAIFCYTFVTPKIIYLLLGGSCIPIFFPNSFFDRIQASRNSQWYRKVGVRYINTFAQSGGLVNKLLKKKFPGYKTVSGTRASIRKHYYQTYLFEKFHFSLFLFFAFMTIHAGSHGYWYWVLILTISNLLYNVYPNLLQQYIRVKLESAKQVKKIP